MGGRLRQVGVNDEWYRRRPFMERGISGKIGLNMKFFPCLWAFPTHSPIPMPASQLPNGSGPAVLL